MDPTTLVLIGRTGNGKSSTGNSILQSYQFRTLRSPLSVTKECKLAQCKWKDGRMLNVIDTPGLFDTDAKRGFIEKEIVRCIDLAKDGVHGFILVLSLNNRFTTEEADAFEKLQILLGPKILDYMIIVFTGGDLLESDDDGGCFTLEGYLSDSASSLKKLINRCNKRVVIFDNRTKSLSKKENQVTQLVEIVDRNVKDNGNCPYTNELFEQTKNMTSELYYIQEKEMAYEEKISLLNEMMKKNLEDMKVTMQATKKELEEKLNNMAKEKNKFYDEIIKLREKLADAENTLENAKQLEQGACCKGCIIS